LQAAQGRAGEGGLRSRRDRRPDLFPRARRQHLCAAEADAPFRHLRRPGQAMSSEVGPQDVIGFWKEAGPDKWYVRNEAFDREIAARFGRLHAAVAAGAHAEWATTPDGALALIIVLDQFSRNLHRDAPEA